MPRFYGQLRFEIDAIDADEARVFLEEATELVQNMPNIQDVYIQSDPEEEET